VSVDIITILQAVLRRWRVSVPLIVLAVGAAAFLQASTPALYQADGQLLLANPELDPSGLPRVVIDIDEVALLLNTADEQQELASSGDSYEVLVGDQNTLLVTASGPSRSAVEGTIRAVGDRIEEYLTQRQEEVGIPEGERIEARGPSRVVFDASDDASDDTAVGTSVVTFYDPTAGITNPYGASNATARLLIVAVESDAGRSEVLSRAAPGAGFTLDQSPQDAAPILRVLTTAPDPADAVATFGVVAETIERELDDRQERAGTPVSIRTTLEPLAVPQRAFDISPPVNRSAAALLGLGGLIAVVVSVAVESIATRRGSRQERSTWPAEWFDEPQPPPSKGTEMTGTLYPTTPAGGSGSTEGDPG
jgi:hypothetical protein